MSSSESSDNELDNKRNSDKSLLVTLLSEHPVLFDKSRVPKVVSEKKSSWEKIVTDYSNATGVTVTQSQLNKTLQNIKTRVKTKIDTKATGNKKIKLKEWEKQLVSMMGAEVNPVFTKVQGSIALGIYEEKQHKINQGLPENTSETNDTISISPSGSLNAKVKTSTPQSYVRPGMKIVATYENDETKDMSTSQLQRVVLLQQLKLQQLQIEKEQKQLEMINKTYSDKEVQTDEVVIIEILK